MAFKPYTLCGAPIQPMVHQYHFFGRSYESCADSDSNPQPCERLGLVIGSFTRSAMDFPLLNYVFQRHIYLTQLIGQEFHAKTPPSQSETSIIT